VRLYSNQHTIIYTATPPHLNKTYLLASFLLCNYCANLKYPIEYTHVVDVEESTPKMCLLYVAENLASFLQSHIPYLNTSCLLPTIIGINRTCLVILPHNCGYRGSTVTHLNQLPIPLHRLIPMSLQSIVELLSYCQVNNYISSKQILFVKYFLLN